MAIITELALFLLLLFFVHGLLNWLITKRRALSTFKIASIPGPTPSFWTGNSPAYIRGYHETLDRWIKQYGPRFGYFLGDMPYLVLSDVEEVQELLVKMGKHFPNRQKAVVSVEPFASSLIDARGDKWKHSRRVLTPPFTAHKLKSTRAVVNFCISRMLTQMEQQRQQLNRIDLAFFMKSITLDVIGRSAFSMDDTDVYEPNSQFHRVTAAIMEDSENFVLTWATYLPFLKKLVWYGYEFWGKYTLSIAQHLNSCIEDYYAKKKNGTTKKDAKENILDFMLEQKSLGNLNENEVMGNAITILVAGYDTTATGLIFAFYLLAKHQEIQEQLREEILAQNTDFEDHCAFEEYRSELLDRVWYESLRLYPPVVTFITRQLDDEMETVTLSKSGTKITKEMTIQIPVWTIHHNAEYWPEPNRFNPWRENLPIAGAAKQSNHFLTFGQGPRNCIGSHLALTEARAVISAVLRRYRVELAEPEELEPHTGLLRLIVYSSIVIHPKKNLYLKLTPLENL